MAKIESTTKKLKAGVRLPDDKNEVRWESTGFLSVRLLDASGTVPLAGRAVKVDIPKEGTVELAADDDGVIAHPDVPFQDYELDLGEGVKVHVPAVGTPDEVHVRHVGKVVFTAARVHLRDEHGFPLGRGTATLTGPDRAIDVRVASDGMIAQRAPVPAGDYEIAWTRDDRRYRGKVTLDDRFHGLVVATLAKEGS